MKSFLGSNSSSWTAAVGDECFLLMHRYLSREAWQIGCRLLQLMLLLLFPRCSDGGRETRG